jgi:hypothetical protein
MTIEQEIKENEAKGLKPFIITLTPEPCTMLVWATDEDDAQDKAWHGEAEYEFQQCPSQPDVDCDPATAEDIAKLRAH